MHLRPESADVAIHLLEGTKGVLAFGDMLETGVPESQLSLAKEVEWWRLRDLNPGHADYDSAALTS